MVAWLVLSEVRSRYVPQRVEGMKCWRVDSTRLELHDSSRQKLTRLTGSQVARYLEIFKYIPQRERGWNVGVRLDSSCTTHHGKSRLVWPEVRSQDTFDICATEGGGGGEMLANQLNSTWVARFVTAKVDSSSIHFLISLPKFEPDSSYQSVPHNKTN